MAAGNPFAQFLEDQPKAAFFSSLAGLPSFFGGRAFGIAPNVRNYFQSQFDAIYNQYLGRLGEMASGGQEPNVAFSDFLKTYPWAQNYFNLPRRMRGIQETRFAPPSRWFL